MLKIAVISFVLALTTPPSLVVLGPPASSPLVAAQRADAGIRGVRFGGTVVVGDYGLVRWSSPYGGGSVLVRRKAGVWRKIGGGGGFFTASALVQLYAVPPPIAKELVRRFTQVP